MGTKKVEGRVPKNTNDKYQKMEKGDLIKITNEDTGEKMKVNITFVHHYPNSRSMLETEGTKNVLSSGGTVEDGIRDYDSFTGYKENLPRYGIYAIGVKPIK
jgi:ASC-1-like (ASCH) protein